MTDSSLHFTEELVLLGLLVLIISVGVFWYRTFRELNYLKALFNELPNPILRVSLNSFAPLICNRKFSELLGYSSNAECIAQFNQHPHLPQQNFYQIYRLTQDSVAKGELEFQTDIVLRNCKGVMVNQHLYVQLDARNHFMDIRLESIAEHQKFSFNNMPSEGKGPLLQQDLIAYFELDSDLNILAANSLARHHFSLLASHEQTISLGDLFSSDNSQRMMAIHKRRLAKQGRLDIGQDAIADHKSPSGQWHLYTDKSNREHYHAFFSPDPPDDKSEFTRIADLLPAEIGLWELDHLNGKVVQNSHWVAALGYAEPHYAIDELSFWASILSTTYCESVMAEFSKTEFEDSFVTQYKIATGNGVEIDIETRGYVVSRDGDGNPLVSRGIHTNLSQTQSGDLDRNSHHQLMNRLASVIGYADLIVQTDGLPDDIQKFSREIFTNSQEMRKQLTLNDQEPEGVSLDKLVTKYHLKLDQPSTILTRLDDEFLDRLTKTILQFAGDGSDERKMTSVSVHLDPGKNCSGCPAMLDDGYSSLSYIRHGLSIDREHLVDLLDPGYVNVTERGTNSLVQASELLHENGGHICLMIDGQDLVISAFLPGPVSSTSDEQEIASQETSIIATDLTRPHGDEMPDLNQGRILIIDDELSVANYLKEIIQRAGYQTRVYTEPGRALDYFRDHPKEFDLVITDQTMPGYSGDVVMQEILLRNPGLPVIMCTGYTDSMSASAARKLGAAGYLTKPVEVVNLIHTIQQSIAAASDKAIER